MVTATGKEPYEVLSSTTNALEKRTRKERIVMVNVCSDQKKNVEEKQHNESPILYISKIRMKQLFFSDIVYVCWGPNTCC